MDELRKDSLGCYGNTVVQTPHLDALAAQSIQFNRAYTTSPWCLPARSSIVTGRFPHNNGAYSNFRAQTLAPGFPNLFNTLKKSGYKTAVIGKCHFAPRPYGAATPERTLPRDDVKAYYLSLGMDHLDLQDGKLASAYFYDDYSKELDQVGHLDAYRRAVWDKNAMRVYPFPAPAEWHPDGWVGRKAVAYLERRTADEPTFTWVSFSGPHYPFDAPAAYYDRVDMSRLEERVMRPGELDDPGRILHKSFHGPGDIDGANRAPGRACKNYTEAYWTELRRNYYANVAQIDDKIGEILALVGEKFADNVLVLFTADHGEMLGNHGVWGKNNCAYEDVLNVPLLVQYPGRREHKMTDVKVMAVDLMPTCLKVAGVILELDGTDLEQNIARGGYDYVFSEGEGFASVSDGRLKYVHVNKPKKGEWYELLDLEQDPQEFENRVAWPEYAPRLAELRKVMINHFMSDVLA